MLLTERDWVVLILVDTAPVIVFVLISIMVVVIEPLGLVTLFMVFSTVKGSSPQPKSLSIGRGSIHSIGGIFQSVSGFLKKKCSFSISALIRYQAQEIVVKYRHIFI